MKSTDPYLRFAAKSDNGKYFRGPNGSAVNFVPIKSPGSQSLTINFENRTVLTMRVQDGLVVAEYNPEDLDASARVFVDTVNRLLGETPRPDAPTGE